MTGNQMTEKERCMEETGPMKPAEKKRSSLSGLHEISKLLLSERDLQKLLNTIAEKAGLVLEADLVTLFEYDKRNDDVLIPPIIKGESKALEILQNKGMAIPHKESITFKMLRRESPFYAPKAKADWVEAGIISKESAENPDSFIHREKIVSSAGIPLCIKEEDEVVGVLFVNYRNYHRFTDAHKEKIEMFANYAAIAIRNARLFEKKNQYLRQLSVLNEIGKTVSYASTLDIDSILYLVYNQAKRLMDVTNFYFKTLRGKMLMMRITSKS